MAENIIQTITSGIKIVRSTEQDIHVRATTYGVKDISKKNLNSANAQEDIGSAVTDELNKQLKRE